MTERVLMKTTAGFKQGVCGRWSVAGCGKDYSGDWRGSAAAQVDQARGSEVSEGGRRCCWRSESAEFQWRGLLGTVCVFKELSHDVGVSLPLSHSRGQPWGHWVTETGRPELMHGTGLFSHHLSCGGPEGGRMGDVGP